MMVAAYNPNFSGRWIPVGVSSSPEQPLTVQHTAASLVVENSSVTGPASATHLLSPERQSPMTTALWRGSTLVVSYPMGASTAAASGSGQDVKTESWSIDRTGHLRVTIELRRSGQLPSVGSFVYSRID